MPKARKKKRYYVYRVYGDHGNDFYIYLGESGNDCFLPSEEKAMTFSRESTGTACRQSVASR